MTREFSDEEFWVLELVSEDAFAFSELVCLGGAERQPQRASQVLVSLLRQGFVEIYGRNDDSAPTHLLTPAGTQMEAGLARTVAWVREHTAEVVA